ncbi:hypothetical protein M885DRAFT_508602 [Pelagophyceae sp. CCMP2097]|nr:hypothetical protein M885DRAFT_508602 [Pelagophyceae sp. CCMP2097]
MRLFRLLVLLSCTASSLVQWCPPPEWEAPRSDFAPPSDGLALFSVSVDLEDGAGGHNVVTVAVGRGDALHHVATDFVTAWGLGDAQHKTLVQRLRHEAISHEAVLRRVIHVVVEGDGDGEGPAGREGHLADVIASAAPNSTIVVATRRRQVACVDARGSRLGFGSLEHNSIGDIAASALAGDDDAAVVLWLQPVMATTARTALVEHDRLCACLGDDQDRPLVFSIPSADAPHDDALLVFDARAFKEWWLPSRSFSTATEIALFLRSASDEGALLRGWRFVASDIVLRGRAGDETAAAESAAAEAAAHGTQGLRECIDHGCPAVVVVVVEQGDEDTSTAGTFVDIAKGLASAVRALGVAARVERCVTLGTASCAGFSAADEQLVVVGVHNLQLYFRDSDGLPVMLADYAARLLDIGDAVVYNFEFVPADEDSLADLAAGMRALRAGGAGFEPRVYTNAAGSYATAASVAIMQTAAAVWDYSSANANALARLGVDARHVALGFSPDWFVPRALRRAIETKGDQLVDVLFYGTLTAHRAAALRELRAPPRRLRVLHLNACSDGVFGLDLDAALFDAKVVLDLRAFGGEHEWKMPRLARLLANERFVVSEGRCDDDAAQCAAFRGGIVFAAPENLHATLAYYLARPAERAAIAKRGRSIFLGQTQAQILRDPLEDAFRARRHRRERQTGPEA